MLKSYRQAFMLIYMWVEINGSWNLFRIYLILSNGRWYRDKKEFKNWVKNLMWIYIGIFLYKYIFIHYINLYMTDWKERGRLLLEDSWYGHKRNFTNAQAV